MAFNLSNLTGAAQNLQGTITTVSLVLLFAEPLNKETHMGVVLIRWKDSKISMSVLVPGVQINSFDNSMA